jgi:hypothetical protein
MNLKFIFHIGIFLQTPEKGGKVGSDNGSDKFASCELFMGEKN